MTNNKLNEDVGKKIVEALKMQSNVEIQDVIENPVIEKDNIFEENNDIEFEDNSFGAAPEIIYEPLQPTFNTAFSIDSSSLNEMGLPTNVTVLKQLISQLPAGVSKQTGAQIIKQTMEAMGTPMRNVLQEAQQVQENLSASTREYQTNITEYKHQIDVLEQQIQKSQKQHAALHDIISLFVQVGN